MAVNIVSLSFFWGPLCWVLAFFTASYQHLLWTPIHQGFPRATSAGCGFPYHISSPTPSDLQLNWPQLPSWLRYVIVQQLHDCPLDLWNRMFNCHQVEITVMQFTGHSLLVHQSMNVPWEFFSSSHFISQFPPTRFPLITAIRMCHLFPVHHLGMAFLVGSKGQNTTPATMCRVCKGRSSALTLVITSSCLSINV